MKVENADSKTDVFVKISLFFFVSLLSFSIGIFVGKKFSDNQHKLALLEPSKKVDQASSNRSHENPEDTASKAITNDEMTEDEIAKLAEEFIEDEAPLPVAKKTESEHNEAKHDEAKAEVAKPIANTAMDSTKNDNSDPSKIVKTIDRSTASIPSSTIDSAKQINEIDPLKEAIKQVADNKLPEAVSKNEKVANKTGGSLPEKLNYDSLGKYTIQVGSYVKEEDATKAAEDLKKKGYAAFYVTAKVKDQSWFRVSIGLFATQKEAVEYKKTLIDNKSVQSAIIQKIVN